MQRILRTPHALLAAAALALSAAACGNISLTTASASAFGGDAPPLNESDASTLADGGSVSPGLPFSGADAGVSEAPSSIGSPLCNYNYAGAHLCQPDDSLQCAGVADDDAGDGGDAAAPGACHVVDVDDAVSQACSAAGTGEEGAQCQTGADCAPSYECVGAPGECRHYCCNGDTSCSGTSSQSFCDVQNVAWGELDASAEAGASEKYNVPVCIPVAPCTLFDSSATAGCSGGQTCSIVKSDGTTSCVDVGAVPVGGSCETDHCQANLACLGTLGSRTCFKLCRVDTPTDCSGSMTCTSSAALFSNAAYGLCQ